MFEHKIDLKDTPMTLAGKPLEAITEADLKSLVENGVSEDKTREYKRSLPRGSDDEKKEFLADVSSFANSAGGDLIYGIAEESGTPTELTGLDLGDTDAVIMRLENLIQNGISPRIPGISVRAVSLEEGSKQVVIIRVPRSFAIPHVVDYGKRWRFYSRNSAGKYPLDVSEVRRPSSPRGQLRSGSGPSALTDWLRSSPDRLLYCWTTPRPR